MTHLRLLLLVKGCALLAAASLLTARLIVTIQSVDFWPGPFVDWRTYANAVARLTSGDGIYSPQQLAGPYHLTDVILSGYAYPPLSVPLFTPFTGEPLGLAAWITLNLGLLLTGLWAIASRCWPTGRVLAFAVALVFLAGFQPFVMGMTAMNINIGIAGAVAWVAVGCDPILVGILGGLGALTKIFPAAIALASSRKLKSALVGSGLVAVAAIVTLPFVGISAWAEFTTALRNSTPDCVSSPDSVACLLQTTIGTQWAIACGVLIGLAAAGALVLTTRPLLMAALVCVAVMAPVTNLHVHYWLIPAVVAFAAVGELSRLVSPRIWPAGSNLVPTDPSGGRHGPKQ